MRSDESCLLFFLLHFHQVLFIWTNQQFLNASQIVQIYFSLSRKNHAMVHGWHNWDKRSRKLSWTKHSAEFMLMQQGHEEGNWGKFAQNSVCNLVGLDQTFHTYRNIKHQRKREWFWYNLDSPGHFFVTPRWACSHSDALIFISLRQIFGSLIGMEK